ncbi:ArsA family ATPase [Halobaculum sp. MBLA0143]|uniref:ArsA family ATPase n=1 Tax=Halobaculum sp. MBLA0143 TaxID=3079933 RepID=UPI003524EB4B
MPEFVLYGGKGGVGKTTLAAATGLQAAEAGRRTLIVSTDPAHSVGDVLDCEVGERPTSVPPTRDLYALEVDPRERFRRRYGETFDELLGDAQSLGFDVDESDVQDVSRRGLVPGADEVAVVDLFAEYDADDDWEVVVFDTAPTGHTLRLLELPDVLDTTVGKLLSARERVRSVTDTVGRLFGGSDDDDGGRSYTDRATTLQSTVDRVGDRLREAHHTEFRVVALPERVALAETRRLVAELDEAGVPADTVLLNRTLREPPGDCPNCAPRYERQRAAVSDATDDIDRTVVEVPLVSDAEGRDRVARVADHVPAVE